MTEDEYRAAKLEHLAGIESQLTRIADNTGHADVVLAEEDVLAAWEAQGVRMYTREVLDMLRKLGITVD
ncbi:hypothetical protein [Microbacterium sp. M1A1_1b]